MATEPAPHVPPQAESLIRAGRTIEAIKQVFDANPGIDLRTAKQAVDAFAERQRNDGKASATREQGAAAESSDDDLPAAAVLALMRRDHAEALRVLEQEHGLGAAEAMKRVLRYAKAHPPSVGTVRAGGSTVVRGDGGGLWWLVALLALVGVAVWYLVR